ncbi:MAG: glycine cleavage system protein T [Proteobacteria bacterium]|nr:glycine cleavage system protein T [Pseudomonadota bacterium]
MAKNPAKIPSAFLAFGSRVRPSPFFEATLRWGCSAYTTYNHFYMPSVYESPQADYRYLTEAVTLWDVAGERQTQISGADAAAFVQYLTPRDLSTCTPGRCRYVLITNAEGGVINDPVLLQVEENKYWLSAADTDLTLWCRGVALNSGFDVEITAPDVSPLQLQGPYAVQVAQALFGDWVLELKYFHLRQFEFEGMPLVISRTGWSGEFGYEIYLCNGEYGDALWERIMQAGEPFGIRPASPSTIRRLEAGLLSYGADANEDDTPFHLGMARLVNLDGGFDFIGKAALQAQQAAGVSRELVGVLIEGAPLDTPLVRWWNAYREESEDNGIGKIRSAVYSPTLQKNIGLAMLNKPYQTIGTVFTLQSEYGEQRQATVTTLPFISNKTR